jgi:hypothetical protein
MAACSRRRICQPLMKLLCGQPIGSRPEATRRLVPTPGLGGSRGRAEIGAGPDTAPAPQSAADDPVAAAVEWLAVQKQHRRLGDDGDDWRAHRRVDMCRQRAHDTALALGWGFSFNPGNALCTRWYLLV